MISFSREQSLRTFRFGKLYRFLTENGLPVLVFTILSIGISWPLVRDFTTHVIGGDNADSRYSVWMLWHYHEWLIGETDLFYAPQLFYPNGISLLVTSLGPVAGVLSLPFWTWGPVAAYNGAVLFGIFLSGYIMYLLARDLSFDRGIALFAGILLEVEPVHLEGMFGHFEHTFIGLLPLSVLAVRRALDSKHSLLWALVTAATLLLAALYNGYQFVFGGFAVVYFLSVRLITAPNTERVSAFRRAVLISICSVIVLGPFLLAVTRAEADPSFASDVSVSISSPVYQPDLVQFFVPPFFQALFGHRFYTFAPATYVPYRAGLAFLNMTSNWGGFANENEIGVTWTGTILCVVALLLARRKAWTWLLLTTCCLVLALGPTLRFLGHTSFTAYHIPVVLPYAFLTSLPGLSFMRVSGRWMMLGVVGAGIAASYGLAELAGRFPTRRRLVTGLAIGFLVLEGWPNPWPTYLLSPVPTFYQQIAHDKEQYGVLDLPTGAGSMTPSILPSVYAADYQMYQMTHHKGIAWAHLSHVYSVYPLPIIRNLIDDNFSPRPDLLLNGKPADPLVNAQANLANAGYRYVVYHKSLHPLGLNSEKEHAAALRIISKVFGQNAKPLVDDNLVQVYQITPAKAESGLHDAIRMLSVTYPQPNGSDWVVSPLEIEVDSTLARQGTLEISPSWIFDPRATPSQGMGQVGVLNVSIGNRFSTSVSITVNRTAKLTIPLVAGRQTITLSLAAGNFRLSDFGGSDSRVLNFGLSRINLQIPDDAASN